MRRPHAWLPFVVAVVAIAGCGEPAPEASEQTLRIYVSSPLRGDSGSDGRDIADGALLALSDTGGTAGGRAVEAIVLDDSAGRGPGARWTQAKAGANARQATRDSTAVAYIGDFESGATRTSLPITNEAGLLQVSAASTAPDLVSDGPPGNDVPRATQSTGTRTFGRVIPGDELIGTAVRRLFGGSQRIAVDGSAYGRRIADLIGGSGGGGVSGADPVVFAGEKLTRDARGIARLLVTDAQGPAELAELEGGVLVSMAAPIDTLPAGRNFAASFRASYDRDPGRYAAYGYEAMAVVLDSIERAGASADDRTAVRDELLSTTDRDSILGRYSIDGLGNTTLDRYGVYEIGPKGELSARASGRP